MATLFLIVGLPAQARPGLDVQFDAESIAELRSAATDSAEAFEIYLEALTYEADQRANMDW